MARVIDANSESGFVFASLMEFMKAWESGTNARLFLESINGSAFVSFGCFLGTPTEKHFQPKKKDKSKKKQERDNLRAANFQAAMNEKEGDPSHDKSFVEEDNSGGDPPQEDTDDVENASDDFEEFMIGCSVDLKVKGMKGSPSRPEFEEIVPEIKSQVVDYVLAQDDVALPRSELEVIDISADPVTYCI